MTSSSEYGKVIIGEPVDDNTPLIATGYSTDPEAAQATAVPMYYRSSPPTNAYQADGYPQLSAPDLIVYERDEGEECAQIGCLFSWIPIVGIITCCVNLDAPCDSKRGYWARIAFCVSVIVIIANVTIYMYTEN
jgi:hypothetical protein